VLRTGRCSLAMVREALTPDQSPEATQIKEKIVEAEQIISGKTDKTSTERAPAGGGVIVVGNCQSKTKQLFEMFHLENRVV
jgi:hypothetical protein